MHDRTQYGEKLGVLVLVDEFTRECLEDPGREVAAGPRRTGNAGRSSAGAESTQANPQ